jgi:hypothetical protein
MKEKLSITDVFRALADENSLSLFNTICTSNTDSKKLMSTFALSKRQYYDRMNDLRTSGLIKRQKGKYSTTSFGEIIYRILKIAEKATERHWKLKALDMMNLPADGKSLEVDYVKIIDVLLDDSEIKDILLRKYFPSSISKELNSYPRGKHFIQSMP